MTEYKSKDNYIREDAINSKENERYFNPFKSIPLYRIYQAITFTASAAHAVIHDAPRVVIGGVAIVTTSVARHIIKKRKQTTIQGQIKPKNLEEDLKYS